jgi:hypothetical protein
MGWCRLFICGLLRVEGANEEGMGMRMEREGNVGGMDRAWVEGEV